MKRYALVYPHPLLMELPPDWFKSSPKKRHEICKTFLSLHEDLIYSDYIKVKDGHDLVELKALIGGK